MFPNLKVGVNENEKFLPVAGIMREPVRSVSFKLLAKQMAKRRTRITSAFLFAALLTCSAIAQTQDDSSRQIVLDQFTRARPNNTTAKSTSKTTAAVRRKPTAPRYTRKSPAIRRTRTSSEVSEIGITIWRLSPSGGEDAGARILVQEKAQPTQWTPQRIEADTPLRVGDRVRISIESPRAGYLYVIDREQHADGSYGDAYLIFPTLRTRSGDNQVRPGKLIDIPAQEDNPSYFTLIPTPGRRDQVAEVLTIIVTQEPIPTLALSNSPLKLSSTDVLAWEKLWANEAEIFEMDGGAGKAWTRAEKEASSKGSSRLLTQEEPTPQTIYRFLDRSKTALLITVPLRYSR